MVRLRLLLLRRGPPTGSDLGHEGPRADRRPRQIHSEAAGTTRGFTEAEFRIIGNLIADVVDGMKSNSGEPDEAVQAKVREEVLKLTAQFPIYG